MSGFKAASVRASVGGLRSKEAISSCENIINKYN